MPKVCIIEPSCAYIDMFISHGWSIVHDLGEADLVQFTGGSDVSPCLYGESCHPETYCNGGRDVDELEVYEEALRLSIPMAGICRGGQFLHVVNGGDMWQHVHGHAIFDTHEAHSPDELLSIDVTSTHHQAMRLTDNGAEILLVGAAHGYCEHMSGGNIKSVKCGDSLESVYYKDTKCLCFQPHPEFRHAPESCTNYYFNKLSELFGLVGVL